MHMELVCKQQNNENIVKSLIFYYIWFFESENLFFILILKEKNDKILIFNIAHFPNLEISASL